MLHDLHPDDVDTRVQRALDQVRPYLGSHAGGVSLSGVDADGVVHLQLEGSCDGCPSSALTVKSAIEDAILVAAPDVVAVEAEGMVERRSRRCCRSSRSEPHERPSERVDPPGPRRAARARWLTCTLATRSVLVANLAGTLVAYLDRCPVVPAGGCRAGRSTASCSPAPAGRRTTRAWPAAPSPSGGEPLRPLPLLPEAGAWKVAVPAGAPS